MFSIGNVLRHNLLRSVESNEKIYCAALSAAQLKPKSQVFPINLNEKLFAPKCNQLEWITFCTCVIIVSSGIYSDKRWTSFVPILRIIDWKSRQSFSHIVNTCMWVNTTIKIAFDIFVVTIIDDSCVISRF